MASAPGASPTRGCVYVLENGVPAEIPWIDVRRWRWEIPGFTKTHYSGTNIGTAIHAGLVESVSFRRALKASGLFVEVAENEGRLPSVRQEVAAQ